MIKIFSILFAALLFLCSTHSFAENTGNNAKNAYYTMEESPFNRDIFNESIKVLQAEYKNNPDNPWVYISYSLAAMQAGYKIGSWYKLKTFNKEAIEKAQEYSLKAIEKGTKESQSYAHHARVLIIKKKYRDAWGFLDKANNLDNDNFYPWFYKARIRYLNKGYGAALTDLDKAENRITHKYQKRFVTRLRQKIARKMGNQNLEEAMYRKNINDFPENAYVYGNYGLFLYRNKRYKESIVNYEKAIAISPYGKAVSMLGKARKKAGLK